MIFKYSATDMPFNLCFDCIWLCRSIRK